MRYDAKTFAAKLRARLRAEGFTGSVRMARRTAYGWVEIWGTGECHRFTDGDRELLRRLLGHEPGGNFDVVSPDSRDYITARLGLEAALGGGLRGHRVHGYQSDPPSSRSGPSGSPIPAAGSS